MPRVAGALGGLLLAAEMVPPVPRCDEEDAPPLQALAAVPTKAGLSCFAFDTISGGRGRALRHRGRVCESHPCTGTGQFCQRRPDGPTKETTQGAPAPGRPRLYCGTAKPYRFTQTCRAPGRTRKKSSVNYS